MSRWFRFYDRALDDPKVQRLAPDVFKGWVNLLCLAARNDGKLPSLSDVAFALRITDREADSLVTTLLSAGLLDDEPDGATPHNWNDLQFLSDRDPTAADRKRRQRDREKGNVTGDVTRDISVPSRPPEQNRPDNKTDQTGARDARVCSNEVLKFPAFGSVLYSPWADMIRQHAPGRDVDIIADDFRRWCRGKDPKPIPFDCPTIVSTLIGFCKSLHKRTASA